jgi:natural product biosynthesis luciferase-like monooxygenase protein
MESPVRAAARLLRIPIIELSYSKNDPAGVFTLEYERAATKACADAAFAETNDIALVLQTSGTTARPKIVTLQQSNIFAGARLTADALELSERDRYLCVMPLFHAHALLSSLATLLTGGSVISTPPFAVEHFFHAMENFRPTWYSAAPTLHQAILQQVPYYQPIVDDNALRLVRSSTAALPPGILIELERVFAVPVIEGYGMTETALYLTSNLLPKDRRKPGSVGLAIGTQVAVVDKARNTLPPGQIGEIVVRGPNVISAYENDQELNHNAFDGDWLHTGDLGYLDEEGFLFLTGRLHEIINRGGEKISPLEVETVLSQHPEVAEAAVFALPHSTLGEEVAAAVALSPASQSSTTDLRRCLAFRLVACKVPTQIVIVDAIPKGPTGKLQRARLGEFLKDRFAVKFVAPQTFAEIELARTWQEVLGLEQVSVEDNFFALGGNSLLATQVLNRVRRDFAIDVSLKTFFAAPTIASFALALRQAAGKSNPLKVTPATRQAAVEATAPSLTSASRIDARPTPTPAARRSSAMDISLFFFSADAAAGAPNKYRLFMDTVQFADRNGFAAVWIPERHFHPFGGLYPNPSVLGAAVATVTKDLQIRAGSVVIPLQDPLRVAEEWSVIDNLSGGRVGLACASGWHVNDFVLAPENYKNRKDMTVEHIGKLRRLWRGESVAMINGSGKRTEVRIFPQPIQPELSIWLASHSDATFVKAAQIGAHVLTLLWDTTLEDLARRISLYRKALARQGQDPATGKVTLMLHTFVGDTVESVKEIVTRAYRQYLSVNLSLQNGMIEGRGGAGVHDKADHEFIIAQATEQLFQSRGLVGTAEVCAAKIAAFKAIGVDEIACLIDFGIDYEHTMASLDRLKPIVRSAACAG